MRSHALLLATLPLAALAAPAAFAQDAPQPGAATDAGAPAEIIVTAQKRAEPLQKVPVAVTVVTGETLAKLSVNSIEDSQKLVPALTFVKGDTSLNSALFLRGLGTVSFSIAAEPSVTSVLDGVVLARAGESFGDLYDLERIEVLRGPQGTLFGKNASAGVINIVTREPGKALGGYLDAGYFEGGEYKIKANIGGPINANWRAGVTAFYSDYHGNIFDTTTQSRINGYQHYGVRGQLIGDIAEVLHVKLIADYRKANDNCCAFVVGALNPTPSAAQAAAETILAPARGGATNQSIQSLPNRTNEETWGVSLQADLALGTHTLTSITSFRRWNNEEIRDGDWVDQQYLRAGAFSALIHDDGPERAHTFTQELRLTSPTGGFLDYVFGAYYYQAIAQRKYTRSDTYCLATTATASPVSGLTPCPAATSTIVNPVGTAVFGSTFNNFAAYGQATWHVTPRFRAVTGLRYTHDVVSAYHVRTDNFTGSTFPGVGGPAGIAADFDANVAAARVTNGAGFTGTPWNGSTGSDNLSGKGVLEYDLAPHNLLYASWSRGYKGPAFNTFFNQQWFNTAPIAPELSDAFELGLKNSFLHGRLVVNLTGFYDKVRNYQANYPTTINGTVTTTIINAGTVSTRGGELEFRFRPTRNLTINGGYSYTDAHVDAFLQPPAAQAGNYIVPGTPLAFAPKSKGALGATYEAEPKGVPFGIEVTAQGSFNSSQVSTLAPTNTPAQVTAFNAQVIGAYGQVDLSVAAVDLDKHWRVAAIVKNLFNDHYASTIGSGGPFGSYLYQIPRDANRYWGGTLRYSF